MNFRFHFHSLYGLGNIAKTCSPISYARLVLVQKGRLDHPSNDKPVKFHYFDNFIIKNASAPTHSNAIKILKKSHLCKIKPE